MKEALPRWPVGRLSSTRAGMQMNAMSALNRFALAKAPKELLQNAVVGLTLQGYEALCQAPTEQSATNS